MMLRDVTYRFTPLLEPIIVPRITIISTKIQSLPLSALWLEKWLELWEVLNLDREMVNLGDEFPNFEKDSSEGKIKFYEFMGDRWVKIGRTSLKYVLETGFLSLDVFDIQQSASNNCSEVSPIATLPSSAHLLAVILIMSHSSFAGMIASAASFPALQKLVFS